MRLQIISVLPIWGFALSGAIPSLVGASPAVSPVADGSACRLPANGNVYLSSGFGYKLNCAPSKGILNGFMFFVDFPDAPAPAAESPQSLYDFFLPDADTWYANASFGQLSLNVSADVSRFHRMPSRSDTYGWQRELTTELHRIYIQDALDALAKSTGRTLGATDVLYIVPTRRASAISFSPTFMGDVRARSSSTYVARKAVTIGQDAFSTWKFKVINHETGHTMCLPDLYPLPSGPTGQYVGGWDMMGYINGPAPDYFAWNKWRLGWIPDSQIACVSGAGSTTHTISPIEIPGSGGGGPDAVKAVVVRRNATAAVVAEVRARLGNDASACATGVLLYTVSTVAETGKGSMRVLDANPGSRGCEGDELNDAPLSLRGTSEYVVAGWGVKVAVKNQLGDSYTVRVDVS